MSEQPPGPQIGTDRAGSTPTSHTSALHPGEPWWHYLDVVLVILAMAPALALGAPVLGYLVGAVGWIVQRAIAETDRRWIRRVNEPVKQLGVSLFEAFGRIWLLAGAIIIAAVVGGREDGLTAALVIFAAYSVAFAIRVITGPPRRRAIQ